MKKFVLFSFVSLLVLGVSLTVYGFFIEPKRITVKHHELGENNGQNSIRLLQLSDIHLQKNYSIEQLEKIVAAVNEEKPDIVAFTGDLFDNFANYGPVEETAALLSRIEAPLGKFAVWGNHDYGGGAVNAYAQLMAAGGFKLLENTGEMIQTSNQKNLYLSGIDDSLFGSPSIESAMSYRTDAAYSVLLSHEPDVVEPAVDFDVSLILSGHSHGGQVNIPFFPVTTALAEKYISGFYSLGDQTELYVNTGLGTSMIPVRIGVPPQIVVFDLYI
ncbi:metallophosphoesterase [Enterococcus sp. BWM-S5]|uniref:Metallophosphoesterase n=1 Tax=Enterococcus larvae TaxID=2794352 RepID=A0ABS4CGS1_9ENTE|nr:metallophosphoesterase [Enterococcus larvae]MBP1045413.1 metallophosphoesterase [Enterococcus larvae]